MSYEGDTPADCARKLADAGADIVGVNCLNGPAQQLPIAEGDARGGELLRRLAAGRVPHHREQPDFTAFDAFPFDSTPMQLARGEMAAFARRGARGRHQLHRLVLRVRAGPRPGDGQGPGQVSARGARVEVTTGKAMSAYEYHEQEATTEG